ncbi:hypothetical protein KSS87_019623 [Heliosperma pusillum]|nr:hypothetical protein KSS87_022798 [Heliosperma pusillum]KAH9620292.1 hypothetical protein KSS87_019623 [Heliosperma pusillum]
MLYIMFLSYIVIFLSLMFKRTNSKT